MAKKRILFVDDDKDLVDVVELVLIHGGYIVETACCGEEAFNKVKTKEFDLVIADVRMPGMDGLELLNKLQDTVRGIKVIVITGYITIYSVLQAIRRGADDFLMKPVGNDDLLKCVRGVLC